MTRTRDASDPTEEDAHGASDDDTHVLDVREIDEPPFDPIVDALADLGRDETLVIVNGFEPEPLYAELDRRGFTHRTTHVSEDEWHVAVEHA
ncbi:DUF2249 domain-containing protein [Halobaculum magnesiiphilum]|uniref:DUF2249 domain-containing protein n=1 Tax=Halobaculum magnesiiphilum TaxID=1017351 RepID=A0A8T8WAU7_9EURY|nr:DUF2249 domain-containing protein [Halobaculum magnesiiphilum]QZP36883.1 DUF2249 domain-containing protein [Halobaculum magnesiiphilum]